MVRILVNKPQRLSTMAVVTDTNQRISLSSSPVGFDVDPSGTAGSMDRPGKKTITRHVSPGTAKLQFAHTVASLDWHEPVTAQLNALLELGRNNRTVRFTGGSGIEQAHWWTIVSLSAQVLQRTPQNEPTRVALRWSLTEAVDVAGSVIGGTNTQREYTAPAPVRVASAPVIVQQAAAVRTYTVVPGDSLWAIAQRFLGNGARWPEIWNMNQDKIANPNLIYPGQVLRIPAG